MRLSPLLPFALLVAMTFAGCLGGEAKKDDATLSDGGATTPLGGGAGGAVPTGDDVTTEEVRQGKKTVERLASAAAPTWTKGRTWSVTVNETGRPEAALNLVVVDDATDYVVGTDNAAFAYHDALMGDLWYLGSVRKDDLAPMLAGVPAPFVQWPLEDGKTWTAADAAGLTVTWRAAYDAAVPIGAVAYQGFAVSGVDANGTLVYEYAYVPDAKWFARFVVHDPADVDGDNTLFTLTVTSFADVFAGDVVQLQTQWLYRQAFSLPTETGRNDPITIPSGLTRVFVYMDLRSGDAWSGVQGYSNATLLDEGKQPLMWHQRLMVLPRAWQDGGGTAKGAACPAAPTLPNCAWPHGNPWEPYVQNFTAFFDSPAAGSWTLAYAHGGTNALRTYVGVVGIVEGTVKV